MPTEMNERYNQSTYNIGPNQRVPNLITLEIYKFNFSNNNNNNNKVICFLQI